MPFRETRSFEDRPDGYLENGHFWLREYVTGGCLLVQMADSGMLQVQNGDEEFDDSVPWPYRPAVTSLRTALDRDRFREAVEDVSNYTFSVLAVLSMGIEYDWDRTPAVIGRAIWNEADEAFVPIDVTERVFEKLGLSTLPSIDREVAARDLTPDTDTIPSSAFASGQAAGIELQKKRGAAVSLVQDDFSGIGREPPEPACQPPDLQSWFEATLDRTAVNSYLDDDKPLESLAVDSLVEVVGGEVARRHFDEIGGVAMDRPDEFEQAVRNRLITLRTDSVGENG